MIEKSNTIEDFKEIIINVIKEVNFECANQIAYKSWKADMIEFKEIVKKELKQIKPEVAKEIYTRVKQAGLLFSAL